jgi:hypothetical protein
MSDLLDRSSRLLSEAQREDWLTVKEFATLARMSESAIREAIREDRLAFQVRRITVGKKGAIRIVVPRYAA